MYELLVLLSLFMIVAWSLLASSETAWRQLPVFFEKIRAGLRSGIALLQENRAHSTGRLAARFWRFKLMARRLPGRGLDRFSAPFSACRPEQPPRRGPFRSSSRWPLTRPNGFRPALRSGPAGRGCISGPVSKYEMMR